MRQFDLYLAVLFENSELSILSTVLGCQEIMQLDPRLSFKSADELNIVSIENIIF